MAIRKQYAAEGNGSPGSTGSGPGDQKEAPSFTRQRSTSNPVMMQPPTMRRPRRGNAGDSPRASDRSNKSDNGQRGSDGPGDGGGKGKGGQGKDKGKGHDPAVVASTAADIEAAAKLADLEFRRRVGAALRDRFARLTPLTLAVHARQYAVVELLIRLGGA